MKEKIISEQLVNDIDELLAHWEDFTHGEQGEEITRLRKELIKLVSFQQKEKMRELKLMLEKKIEPFLNRLPDNEAKDYVLELIIQTYKDYEKTNSLYTY